MTKNGLVCLASNSQSVSVADKDRSYEREMVYPSFLHGIRLQSRYLSPLTEPLLHGWKSHIQTNLISKVAGSQGKFLVEDGNLPQLLSAIGIINCYSNKLYYVTPDGRKMSTLNEIESYLMENNNRLSIDQFTLDCNVSLHTKVLPKEHHCMKLFISDLSTSVESMPIICFNNINSDKPPDFHYISSLSRIVDTGVTIVTNKNFMLSCDCTNGCVDSSRCVCRRLTETERQGLVKKGYAPSSGYQNGRLLQPQISGVFECNQHCGCGPKCGNRVVQQGPRHRLAVFRTQKMGWGLMALDDIPKGTFITTYNGLICNEETGDKRGLMYGDEYLTELDYIEMMEGYQDESNTSEERNGISCSLSPDSILSPKQGDSAQQLISEHYFCVESTSEEPSDSSSSIKASCRHYYNEDRCYIVDAKAQGNIGRFINHNCSPNLFVQNVFIDTHDLRFPWIAFFAENSIKAFSELYWDYGYIVDSVEGKTLNCLCGAENCRKRLL